MRPKLQKQSALKLAGRNEAKTSKVNNLKVTIGALKFSSRIIPHAKLSGIIILSALLPNKHIRNFPLHTSRALHCILG